VTAPPAGVVLPRSRTSEDLTSVAASAQDQIDLAAWSLRSGLRYTDQQQFMYGAVGTLPVTSPAGRRTGVLYRVSAQNLVRQYRVCGVKPNQVSSSSNRSPRAIPGKRKWAGNRG
jgi:hypothetical protein